MENIPEYYKIKLDPAPNPEAVVQTEHARFTVLTPRLIRMEWSPTGTFEDRASQAFWFRAQPAPKFTAKKGGSGVEIETEYLRLHYTPDETFASNTLWVELKYMPESSVPDFKQPPDLNDIPATWRKRFANADKQPHSWYFGDPDPANLGGTARTVDGVDGATPLSLGLISRAGWSVVDDSTSLVFNDVGWLEARDAPAGQLDLYFLGFGHDYLGCLRDFNLVSGAVPMIPRFVLGNWWSRYWAYSEGELKQLMNDFQSHDVPLSVCIIDMDWHITKTNNDSTGWTGYTWNRALFPDPAGMLRFLHEKGLKVALNLHPAEGVHRHEEMYAEMAEAIGQDPQTGEPVEFDIPNPRFVNAYFNILHHPQEQRGVDFWWMDWQQGQRTRLSGLDPLWWLNHLHFLDLGRDGRRRSFIFSRWGGLGNHRYPIGFSGDSVVSWASLAFQPYFTATSSNVNYGWWSHDIGGHMGGVEDSELYTRWVQMGAFQPVLRMHSTNNPFHERTPWGYDAETFIVAQAALQLRHAMIPYLYSMAWRYHKDSVPPILPMYYNYPEQEDAYACPNQYLFGDQLLVAPFITPKDADTRLSRAAVWMPEGDWYNFFTGEFLPGDGWHALYGTLRDIPVYAKAGAIVPTGPMAGHDNVEVPNHLVVHVFPGADGRFELYEDEGNTMSYLEGAYATTPLTQSWAGSRTTLAVGPAEGAVDLLPAARQVDVLFRGFKRPDTVTVTLNGAPVQVEATYRPETRTLELVGLSLKPTDRLEVTVECADGSDLADKSDSRPALIMRMLRSFRMETGLKADMAQHIPDLLADAGLLGKYLPQMADSQVRALLEIITGAGLDYTTSTGEPLIVVWNNHEDPRVTEQFALARKHQWWMYKDRYPWANAAAPRFIAYRPVKDFGEKDPWLVQLTYDGIHQVKVENK